MLRPGPSTVNPKHYHRKLMLRRVGDHEASSATRAAELGDGTTEIRDVDDAVAWVRLFGGLGGGRSLLNSMNDCILVRLLNPEQHEWILF